MGSRKRDWNPISEKVRANNMRDVAAYKKEYYSRPEVKERTKQWAKEYYSREDIKKKRNEYSRRYNQKEEVKAKYRAYKRIYRARPEVKARLGSPKSKYNIYRLSAKNRGIEFTLTFEQFLSFYQKPCYYCGDPIETVRLDRVDNSKGYILNNVVSCCWECNKLKSDMDAIGFVHICLKVAQNLINKNQNIRIN
jgi:5-methylcytosine-specific restriction endonuclease McrA